MPVTRVTEFGGEFPSWSADGSQVLWALGNALFAWDRERAQAVADSLESAAREGAARQPAAFGSAPTSAASAAGSSSATRRNAG